jgi:hypothetical protein
VTTTRRCEHDWQGPADAECVDDLRVIPCQRVPGHRGPHIGVCDDLPIEEGSVRFGLVVQWDRGTDDLYDARDRLVQHQFVPADSGDVSIQQLLVGIVLILLIVLLWRILFG